MPSPLPSNFSCLFLTFQVVCLSKVQFGKVVVSFLTSRPTDKLSYEALSNLYKSYGETFFEELDELLTLDFLDNFFEQLFIRQFRQFRRSFKLRSLGSVRQCAHWKLLGQPNSKLAKRPYLVKLLIRLVKGPSINDDGKGGGPPSKPIYYISIFSNLSRLGAGGGHKFGKIGLRRSWMAPSSQPKIAKSC